VPNVQIADKLCQAADILAVQGAAPFRIAAYRRAADTVCALNIDLATIAAKGGRDALEAVPSIGPAIAGAVAEMLATGRWAFLDHLKGATDPETLFQAVPGI
jgi:DNA polymerase (family X)